MGIVSSSARIARMAVTRETVDKIISSDKVVIFSKTSCPFCKLAKEVGIKKKSSFFKMISKNYIFFVIFAAI